MVDQPVPLSVITFLAWDWRTDEPTVAGMLDSIRPFTTWAQDARKFDPIFARCQSPAERVFLLGCTMQGEVEDCRVREIHHGHALEVPLLLESVNAVRLVEVRCQPKVKGLRLHPDFEVRFADGPRVFVEIDGHDYHHANKSQVVRDKRRDRAIVESGHTVIRFAASEVFAEPQARAREALRTAYRLATEGAAA